GGAGNLLARLLRKTIPGGERRRKPRDVRGNPIAWRESHTRGSRVVGVAARWGYAVLALGAAFVALGAYHSLAISPATFSDIITVLMLVELAVLVLVAIYMSAGSISREREDKSLDLLLTTPISPQQYVWGKLRGLVSFLSLLLAVPVLTLV